MPLASTRPRTRGVWVGSVVVNESPPAPVAPGAASYPVTAMKRPSAERSIRPSDRDWPVAVSRWLPSAAAVGRATDWTLVPVGPYSSRNTGAALLDRAAAPVPTR